MIRIQQIERKNRFGAEYRGRIPTDTQELSITLEKSPLGASAEMNTNGVMARKIDNEYPADF